MSTSLASLSALTDLVRLQLPHCNRALALDALKHAARELCRRTGIWTEDIAVTTAAGTLEYTLTVPTGAVIEALLALEDSDGNVIGGFQVDFTPPATVTFAADPGTDAFVMQVLCTPADDDVPAWLLTAEADTLRAGAVSLRQQDAATPWSSPNWPLAEAKFAEGIRSLAIRKAGAFTGRYSTALQGVRVL